MQKGRMSKPRLLALLAALALPVPLLQELQDGFLHLARGVGPRKIFPDGFVFQGQPVQLGILHDIQHGVIAAFTCPAQSLDTLGLGQGRRVFAVLHGLQKIPLLVSCQIGQLHSGIEGNFLLVYQVQQFRNQVGEADIPVNPALVS